MSQKSWTNPTIRKQLGEAGFLEVKDETFTAHHVTVSLWRRGQIELKLYESANLEPELVSLTGKPINPDSLGVRNENTQTGEHPT